MTLRIARLVGWIVRQGFGMFRRIRSSKFGLLAAAVLLSAGLSACAPADHLWLNAPDWSRATLVGTSLAGDSSPPVLDERSQPYLLLTQPADDGSQILQIVALDSNGQERWRQDLPYKATRIVEPRLVLNGLRLAVFWIDDETLWGASFDPTTRKGGQAIEVSADSIVGSYDVVQDGAGELHLWFAGPRRSPGLYRGSLDSTPPTLIDPDGILPDLEIGPDGNLHAFWAHYPSGFGDVQFFYGQGEPAGVQATYAQLIVSPRVGPTSVLQGPDGAVEAGTGYVFWTVIERTGLSAGSGTTRYVAFSTEAPAEQPTGEFLRIPGAYHLPYQPWDAVGFQVGERASLPAPSLSGTSYTADTWAVGSVDETAVAVSTSAEYLRNKRELQTGLAFLRGGQIDSYQLLSFTPAGSTRPALSTDQNGYLYLTWLEKSGDAGFLVYFAGSSPAMVSAMEDLTASDVARVLADSAFGMLTGMLLAPLAALISVVIPLLLLALTSFLRKDSDSILSPGTSVSLLISLVAFWYAKLGMLPSIGEYVPFSAWVPFLPMWSEGLLRLGIPALTAVLGIMVGWAFTYRLDRRSPVYFMLIYAAVDGLITGAMYGVQFYGAF
jgi:hypothetical protein